jgi:hypothetical protein
MLKTLRLFVRQLTCTHPRRILDTIFREPLTYTRLAQYYCPDCERMWASGKMPEGIR